MQHTPFAMKSLVIALLGLAPLACSSNETREDAPRFDEKRLEVTMVDLDSRDASLRKDAREEILRMGRRVCRALARELAGRMERSDTGSGFVCLLRMLGALGGEEACTPLSRAARKRALEDAVRVEAVRALGTLGSPQVVGALLECAGETEPLVLRLASVSALGVHNEAEPVRSALARYLCTGSDPVRESAARSLLSCPSASVGESFRLRLLDASPGVRLLAVTYFTRRPSPGAEPILKVLAAHDPDIRVASAASKALEAIGK